MTKKEFLKYWKENKFSFLKEDGEKWYCNCCGKKIDLAIDEGTMSYEDYDEIIICYHCAYKWFVDSCKSKCVLCGKKDKLILSTIIDDGWICKKCNNKKLKKYWKWAGKEIKEYTDFCFKEGGDQND